MNKERATHLRHCFQGEYNDSCKYGESDCPAKREDLAMNKITDKQAKELREEYEKEGNPVILTIYKYDLMYMEEYYVNWLENKLFNLLKEKE